MTFREGVHKIYLSILFVACQSYSYAQEESYAQVALGTGYDYLAMRSDLISSYTHTGATLPLQLFYRNEKGRNRHHFQINFASSILNSSSFGISTSVDRGSFQYGYHRRIGNSESKIKFFGGGVVDSRISYRDNLLNDASVGNNKTGEIISSLSPSILAEAQMGGGKVSAQLWFSLLAYEVSPGYAQNYTVEQNWMSVGTFSKSEWRISYSRSLGPRLNARLDGQWQYFVTKQYETLQWLGFQAVVSLGYKFHKREKK